MPRSVHFLTFGQSYAEQGYGRGQSYGPFAIALRRAIATSASAIGTRLGITVAADDMVQLRQIAVGGSAIRQANDGGTGWWVQNNNNRGSLLTPALAVINAYPVKPQFALWSHGERDAQVATTQAEIDAVQTAITSRLFPDIRAALNASAPNSVRIFVDLLGFRYLADQDRENGLRDMMLSLLGSQPSLYRGAEKYAIELDSTFHPTERGYLTLGAHAGRQVAAVLATGVELEAPGISTATRSGNRVDVTISVPAGKTLVKPAMPSHFGVYDAGGVRMAYRASWAGNVLSLTTPNAPARLRYPAREAVFDASRIVRLSDPVDPLFLNEPGIPLQSRLPITL